MKKKPSNIPTPSNPVAKFATKFNKSIPYESKKAYSRKNKKFDPSTKV